MPTVSSVDPPLTEPVAEKLLDLFEHGDVLARARSLGVVTRARLDRLAAAYPGHVTDVRGLGAMLAIEFRSGADASGKSLAQRVVASAFEHGLVALTAGPKANALRILVPLLASEDELTRGFAALERACEHVLNT